MTDEQQTRPPESALHNGKQDDGENPAPSLWFWTALITVAGLIVLGVPLYTVLFAVAGFLAVASFAYAVDA
jgi:hypothetical protein